MPPPYEPDKSQISSNDHWENTGKIIASFISSSRTLGVNTNTGSPSFDVSFIASASNIDSLSWSFPEEKRMILSVKSQKQLLTKNLENLM